MVRPLVLLSCLGLLSCGGIAESTPHSTRQEGSDDSVEPQSVSLPAPDCSGDFGEWNVLFEDPGWSSQALAPSSDGLEFFYARLAWDKSLDDSGVRLPTLRTRPNIGSDFGEATTLWNVAAACETARAGTELAGLDLSFDGKRLYLVCSSFEFAPGSTGPLLMFERTGPGAPFEQPPNVVGEVGISISLTRDELRAFGTSLDPAISTVVSYERSSLAEPFGPGEVAPGAVTLSNAEPAPDGLSLWGVVRLPESFVTQLGVAWYDEAAGVFEPPIPMGAPPPEGSSDVSPALSGNCREIYIARYTKEFSSSQVLVARR